MKRILSSSPLLITATAIAITAIVTVFNLCVVSPEAIGLGAGFVTCAGLCAMAGVDTRANRCC